ncbi:MAG: RagB/SusD family nutrient uptake outer membrane protein [Bacteroidales bacterium]|nr:RagB/SusD family nutrient uptake outer membrane protein [Bacteroidales bacterium]
MKKYLFPLVAAITLCGCSLEEKILSSSTQESYYQTPAQCITGLNACYTNIRNIYNNKEYFVVCEGQSDLLYINRSDQPNAVLMVTPSTPRFGSTLWTYCYLGVSRVNSVEAAILRSPMSDDEKAPLLAEATVLRSLFYWLLTANFGDVPFYKDEVTDATNSRISRLPRMSASDTRNTLIADLHKWILEEGALDMKRTHDPSSAQYCRAGAPLGLMLAGKMCLWEQRWTDAIEFFGALEDIYGDFSQYPLADIPFSQRQTPESIFEISNIAVDYGLQVQGTLASICTPYRRVSSAEGEDDEDEMEQPVGDIYDGIGIPEMGDQQRTQTPFRPTKRFYQKLMPYSSTDLRRAAYASDGSYIEGNAGYLAWGWPGYYPDDDRSAAPKVFRFFNATGSASGRPYLGNKFWCFGMQYNLDSNSYKVYRYAGAILGLAEAWFQKEDDAKACYYLNMIKERAGIPAVSPASFATHEDLLHEIQDEYGRELFGEYQRKHDLVRWGIWYETVWKYNVEAENNTRLRANMKPCHQYYPIPDDQVINSQGALDNKEYNKYGL